MAKKNKTRRYVVEVDDKRKTIVIDRDGELSAGDRVLFDYKLNAGYKIQFIDPEKKQLKPDSVVYMTKEGLRTLCASKKPELVAELDAELADTGKKWMSVKKKYLDLLK